MSSRNRWLSWGCWSFLSDLCSIWRIRSRVRLNARPTGEGLDGALVGRFGLLVGDQLAELGLVLLTDGRLERDRRLRRALG